MLMATEDSYRVLKAPQTFMAVRSSKAMLRPVARARLESKRQLPRKLETARPVEDSAHLPAMPVQGFDCVFEKAA